MACCDPVPPPILGFHILWDKYISVFKGYLITQYVFNLKNTLSQFQTVRDDATMKRLCKTASLPTEYLFAAS